ncbi:MAG: pyridoxamine 5'-phosphate oxidase [Ferruginibacter sp.]
MNDIASIRKDYKLKGLDEKDVQQDPIDQFEKWWQDVLGSTIEEVNAMTLATANKSGRPSARIVLLKGFTKDGFIFFTNYESHKGLELRENPQASLVFFWKELERQVRIEGLAEKISAEESDSYFKTRPEGSKIGAWASPQSKVIASREFIETNVSSIEKKFTGSGEIQRPPHWGGYIIRPSVIEFWQGRPSRLHDRIQYTKLENGTWKIERLAP